MKVAIKDSSGKEAGDFEVKFAVIEDAKGEQAVHDAVVAYMAAQRSGTACTKTMGEVRGTGKKPWRQKGTGRARAGSFASPLWRGGGVTHGPKPRDFTKKVNKKVRQLALRKALSERLKMGDVLVVDDLAVSAPKTKEFLGIVRNLGVDQGTSLFVIGAQNENAVRASHNLPNVEMTTGLLINTYDVLKYDKLVFTRAGFEQVEQRLSTKP
jgi:large subunit ribosomal protein L4